MDALGVDRAHAVVLGPSSLFGVACVLELLDHGFEVHLPPELLPPPDLWPVHPERLHPIVAGGLTPAEGHGALAELRDRHPTMSVSVLTVDPPDAALAQDALTAMGARSGGRLLVRGPGPGPAASRSSVTVLTPSASSRWIPWRLRRSLNRRPDSDLGDALVAARRAVGALVARRPRASYGVQWRTDRSDHDAP